jgi:trk system potassium uptake protein TrkH
MRLYFAVFHSVSAFCNAGFSLWSNNLEGFAADWATLGTIMALIVLGGLGFVVLGDLAGLARRRRPKGQGRRLRLQSRVVLRMTFALIALGAAALYIAEHKGVLASISPSERAAVCLFQSVTARTAGFNTVPIGSLTPAALFAIILLMYVGASPNSTGGGIKTTTFWTMLRLALAALKSRPRIQSDLREVPLAVVQKAIHVMVGYTLVLVLGVFALLVSEARPGAPGGGPFSFLELLFEATSALGTVGLSCGITPKLSATGKLILIGLMFAGRVGPLTLALSVVRRPEPQRVRYPEERVMIG